MNYTAKHLFTSEEKLERYGNGEWIEEPDWAEGSYKGYSFQILRNSFGVLCGYVILTLGHPWSEKDHKDLDVQCHGGLTYSNDTENGQSVIGFDCHHYGDICPRYEKLDKDRGLESFYAPFYAFKETINKLMGLSLEEASYKNLDFVIKECKSIIDQAIEAGENKETQ